MWYCISKKIKALRNEKFWSQTDLADRLGLTRGVVGHWEAGTRSVPGEAIRLLSVVLGFDFVSIWQPPPVYFPDENRRLMLPPYPIQASSREFNRLGYVCPTLPPLVPAEMEAGYPRDTVHELVAAFKVLGSGGQLCFSSLDALNCPLLVTTGDKYHSNGLRHMRHALIWGDIVIVPHPAGLNLGDCCSYALAAYTGEPMVFKGKDFARTDILAVAY